RVDAMLSREVDEQALEELDADVGQMLGRFLEHLLAILEAEQRLRLLRVADHGDDHFVEMPGRPFDDVEVAEGHRIERSGAESDRHAVSPSQVMEGSRRSKAYRRKSVPTRSRDPAGRRRDGAAVVRRSRSPRARANPV